MAAKEAVKAAKDYIEDLFADESIARIGLEELEFRPEAAVWEVTIGFRRSWKTEAFQPSEGFPLLSPPRPNGSARRSAFGRMGEVVSVKHRDVSVPA